MQLTCMGSCVGKSNYQRVCFIFFILQCKSFQVFEVNDRVQTVAVFLSFSYFSKPHPFLKIPK